METLELRNKILKYLEIKEIGAVTHYPRFLNEIERKLKTESITVRKIIEELTTEGLIEKLLIPCFKNHIFYEAVTSNLDSKVTDFAGLQDPDDFEEIDSYDLVLKTFYRKKKLD